MLRNTAYWVFATLQNPGERAKIKTVKDKEGIGRKELWYGN